MQKILVVIDMQPGFKTAIKAATIQAIKARIDAAKAESIPIFFVELHNEQNPKDFGHTLPELLEQATGYAQSYVVNKMFNDGSWFIKQKLAELGMKDDAEYQFIVTGVNTEACVCETCDGLLNEFKNKQTVVLVPRDSTNGSHDQLTAFEEMRFIKQMDDRLRIDPPYTKSIEDEYGPFETMEIGIIAARDHQQHMFTNEKLTEVGPAGTMKLIEAEIEKQKPHSKKKKVA